MKDKAALERIRRTNRAMRELDATAGYLLRKARTPGVTPTPIPDDARVLWQAIPILHGAVERMEQEGTDE